MLAYCQSFIKNHDVNTVAKALENYFEEQELFSARQLLRNKFSEMLQGMDIIKVKQRTSSSLRSSCNAIAQDIAEAVYKLSDHMNAPTFIVSDLRKLPILQPDMLKENCLAERLLLMEKKLLKMEEWKEEQQKSNDADRQRLRKIEDEVTQKSNWPHPSMPTPFPAMTPAPPNNRGSNAWNVTKSWGTESKNSNVQYRRHEINENEKAAEAIGGTVPNGTQSQAPGVDDNDGHWQLQPQQRRKEVRDMRKERSRQNQRIQGSANNTDVKAGPGPNRDLWIYNVDKEMDDQQLRKFIEDGGSSKSGKVHIRLWEARYEDHWDTKKFRMTIGLSDYARVFTEEFWPKDIYVRKYWVKFDKEKKEVRSETATNNTDNS